MCGANRVEKAYWTGRKEISMTREQAKQALIGMGVAEPSEEQVSKLLDSISAETKKEKDKNVSLKEKAAADRPCFPVWLFWGGVVTGGDAAVLMDI